MSHDRVNVSLPEQMIEDLDEYVENNMMVRTRSEVFRHAVHEFLPRTMTCPQCGWEPSVEDAEYCIKCGAEMEIPE